MDKDQLISEIVRMELEITSAIYKGHKCSENDEFQLYRELIKTYRNIVFGDNEQRRQQRQVS